MNARAILKADSTCSAHTGHSHFLVKTWVFRVKGSARGLAKVKHSHINSFAEMSASQSWRKYNLENLQKEEITLSPKLFSYNGNKPWTALDFSAATQNRGNSRAVSAKVEMRVKPRYNFTPLEGKGDAFSSKVMIHQIYLGEKVEQEQKVNSKKKS